VNDTDVGFSGGMDMSVRMAASYGRRLRSGSDRAVMIEADLRDQAGIAGHPGRCRARLVDTCTGFELVEPGVARRALSRSTG
jgi:hypothetical protein